MKYTRSYLFWFAIASISVLWTACHKDPSKVGFDIQPDSDYIELYGDSTSVVFASFTVEHDSITTTNLETLVLGSINDPVFGSTQAAFNTQFRLSTTNPNLGKDPILDSICLQLAYSGRWGDSTTWMTVSVYKLTDSLFINSDSTAGKIRNNYYSTDVIGYDPDTLGTKTFLDQPFDSVELKRSWLKRLAGTHAPFLSIKLDNKYGEDLLSHISKESANNNDLIKEFPGLHVAVDSVSGSFGKMLYFNVKSPETKLVMYYSYINTTTNTRRDSSYAFVIDDKATRFNEYRVNHSVAQQDLQNQLSSTSPQSGDQRLYLQPFGGVRIKVSFSGIEKLRERKNTVINEAKLYLNIANVEPSDIDLPPVQQLAIYTINSSGTLILTDDNVSAVYMGGKYDKDKNRYVMRITRYLQKRILNESMDNDNLYISISGASYHANRAVLYGNNPNDDNDKKVKIKILYSEY